MFLETMPLAIPGSCEHLLSLSRVETHHISISLDPVQVKIQGPSYASCLPSACFLVREPPLPPQTIGWCVKVLSSDFLTIIASDQRSIPMDRLFHRVQQAYSITLSWDSQISLLLRFSRYTPSEKCRSIRQPFCCPCFLSGIQSLWHPT